MAEPICVICGNPMRADEESVEVQILREFYTAPAVIHAYHAENSGFRWIGAISANPLYGDFATQIDTRYAAG